MKPGSIDAEKSADSEYTTQAFLSPVDITLIKKSEFSTRYICVTANYANLILMLVWRGSFLSHPKHNRCHVRTKHHDAKYFESILVATRQNLKKRLLRKNINSLSTQFSRSHRYLWIILISKQNNRRAILVWVVGHLPGGKRLTTHSLPICGPNQCLWTRFVYHIFCNNKYLIRAGECTSLPAVTFHIPCRPAAPWEVIGEYELAKTFQNYGKRGLKFSTSQVQIVMAHFTLNEYLMAAASGKLWDTIIQCTSSI